MLSSPGVDNDGGGVLGAHPRLHPGDDDDDGRPVRTFEPIVGCAGPPRPAAGGGGGGVSTLQPHPAGNV